MSTALARTGKALVTDKDLSREFERRYRLGLVPKLDNNGGHICVYNNTAYEDIIVSNNPDAAIGLRLPKSTQESQFSPETPSRVWMPTKSVIRRGSRTMRVVQRRPTSEIVAEKRRLQMKTFETEQERVRARDKKRFLELRENKIRQEEDRFQRMLASIDDAKADVDEIGQRLKKLHALGLEKKETLWRRWNERVFLPIQRQIESSLSREKVEELKEKRDDLYKVFLSVSKQNNGMYLDLEGGEYNPFEWQDYELGYSLKNVSDPLKTALKRHSREMHLLEQSPYNHQPNVEDLHSEPRLDVKVWATGKIESTPHGYFSKPIPSNSLASNKAHTSAILFDHYNVPKDSFITFPHSKRMFPGKRSSTFKALA